MQPPLVFFDLGATFGWAYLSGGGRVFSGHSFLRTEDPRLRWAQFRTLIVPLLARLRPVWGYEMFRGNFVSRDAVRMLFGLETGLLEVAAVYGLREPKTIAPSSLKKWATGSGRAEKPAMVAKSCEIWKTPKLQEDEAEALLGLAWMMEKCERSAAFPLRSRQPVEAVIGNL